MPSRLFQPLKIGKFEVSNRLVMAPLTRFRADDSHVPLPFVAEYYAQRASYPGTLLITEATFVSPEAGGYDNVPGIYNADQIAGWKKVTDAVHAKGSFIYLQLWGLGRAAHEKVLKKELGEKGKVVSASNIPFEGGETPTALTEEEILNFIQQYKQGAINAIEAGFDGVEIHSANGYLIDQFVQDVSNDRTDAWGGSVEKRARFGLEIAKAVTGAVGADKVGIRISPYSVFQGMAMKDPVPQFSYYATELKKLNLAYLHVVESRVMSNTHRNEEKTIDFLHEIWDQSPVLVAGGFSPESAYKAVDEEHPTKDLVVVFGRYFISTPDLVFRVKEKIDLNPYDRSTFYAAKQTKGYTDYPFSEQWQKANL